MVAERQELTLVGTQPLSAEEEHVVKALLASLRRIRYGSVQIVVQDGHVVQIDTLEKQRFNHKDSD
jgi:hypothetical protein